MVATPVSALEELIARVKHRLSADHVGIFVYSCPCDDTIIFPITRCQKAALDFAMHRATPNDLEPLHEAVRNLSKEAMNSIGQFIVEHKHHHGRCVFATLDVP